MSDYNTNLKAVYSALQKKNIAGIGTEDEFAHRMQKPENRRYVYDKMSSLYNNVGTFEDFESRFAQADTTTTDAPVAAGTPASRERMSPQERTAAANARMREMNERYTGSPTGDAKAVADEEQRRRAELAAEKAAREQDAKRLDDLLAKRMANAPDPDPDSTRLRTMLQDRMANEGRQKEEQRDIREEALRSSMADFNRMRQSGRPATSSLDEAPEDVSVEGKSREELEKMKPMYKPDIDFVEEYEKRREEAKKMEDAFRASRAPAGAEYPALNEAKEWLERYRAQYEGAKKRADEFHYALGEQNAPYYDKRIEEINKKQEEMNANAPKTQDHNSIWIGTGGYAAYPEDISKMPDAMNNFAANQMLDMAKQQYRQGNKYDKGYKGDNLERLWTGIEQFVGGAANNIDLGSFTFGASEGSALKTARNVGDKYNEVITSTLKDMGVSEQDIVVDLTTIETSANRLNEIAPELERTGAEIDSMKATYEDLVRRGDPGADAYAAKIQRKINEYNKLYKQYEPLKKQYDDAKERYDKVMNTIDDRVKGELSDSERAVLDAFDEFTRAKMERSKDVSTAAKAGAGAEQSAEFMLDFILTGGIAKGGTKVATKLATKRMLKKLGREKVLEMAAKGAIKPGFGLTLATDAVVSGIRTGLMFPRNLQSYSENLTEYTGKDAAGRYNFDRSHLNAALNTALTQYIEYWSEGFGEYFGAGEQALFKAVTGKAPKTAIGATLRGYRGSIGQFLDHGKFDGMLNEMLEEVVGSTFNSLAGWMSNDRVGDKQAIKEFWAGENLATLALSFLPMSAISSATNMRAYNKMKERHDMGVAVLNPLIKTGAIKEQDLRDLVEMLPEMTPEEATKAIVEINDNARKANGGKLPDNYAQALMGYLEGEFAMGLRNQEWEDSQEKMAVVNAYTSNYTNPNAANAWDYDQNLQAATQAAVAAGFTEEELEKDSYMIGQDAMQLRIDDADRADVLMDYATAKAAVDGLQQGYAEQTKQVNDARDAAVRENLDVNGNVIAATIGGNRVFVTTKDVTVNPDGTISTPTGDGLVAYRTNEEEKEPKTAKAGEFTDAVAQSTDSYVQDVNARYDQEQAARFEKAKNTVSPMGQMRALSQVVGRQVVVSDHNGVYAPVSVERMTSGGQKVVIKGDKKQMQGIAAAMGVRVPAGQYLEAEVSRLYPLLDTQEDGSLTVFQDTEEQQKQMEEAEKAAQESKNGTQLPEVKPDTWHTIDVNGKPTDVRVFSVNDDGVTFEYKDENGEDVDGRMSLYEFQNAVQRAQEPAPAETPAAAPAEVAPERSAFPVNEETGEKIYDHPSVTPEAAFSEIMADAKPGSKNEANRLKAIDRARAGAHQDLNIAEASIAKAQREKAQVDEWELPDDESLDAFEQRKARARADADMRIAELERQIPELQRKADHWDAVMGMAEQRAAQAAADKAKALRKRIVNRAKKWEKLTGVKVEFLDDEGQVKKVSKAAAKDIQRGKKEGYKIYGWYDPQSGKVYIYTPSFDGDLSEIDKTYIHEVVSHKGLRGLLTDPGYDELCDRVWNELMTDEDRTKWRKYNNHLEGKGHDEQYLRRAAADEFIAHVSENLNEGENKSLFDKIVEWVKEILDRLMSDTDIESEAKEKVAAAESISTDLLKELLADSMARFVQQKNGAKPLSTESLKPEIQAEMKEKGLEMDGGVVMDEQQTMLKRETDYKTPNELDEVADPVVGDIRFSRGTMPAWEQTYRGYENAREHVIKVLNQLKDRIAVDELVSGVTPRGTYKYGEKSSGSFSGPLRTNIEYIVTFDMDTSCPRSLQYLEYVKKIERQIGRPLTQRESVQLIEMMRVYGQMIPCVYCYCENKRQALKQYFTNFMESRHAVLSAETDEEALDAMYGHATGAKAEGSRDPKVVLTKAAYDVFKKWRADRSYNPTMKQLWREYNNDRNILISELDYMLDSGKVSTLMTDEEVTKAVCQALGIDDKAAQGAVGDIVSEWKWNRIEDVPHEGYTPVDEDTDTRIDQRALSLWREMTLYGKSASSAKNVLRYVPYTDELKDLDQEQKDYINGMGGLRMHSSNDFRIDYFLDYLQFMADMEVNGMMGHTYTKSPEFVRIFGNSGYKINMSIAAYEDSRGIHPNPQEGFDWNEAKELREKFPNAGVMLMATSDNQIQMALDSDWIDMFIPFHHSGLPKEIWYQMRHWDDYTASQNEKFLNTDERKKALKADGVEIPKGAKAADVEKLYNEHFGIIVETYVDADGTVKRIRPHFLPGKTVVNGVEIPGHNNDLQTYLDLCRRYGVHPRFYGVKVKDNTPEGGGREVDITEHPQYMKCIKETARTDSPQTPIHFNFDEPSAALNGKTPIDYAMEELWNRANSESEKVGGPVRSIYESYKQDPYGIVPQFINDIIKHGEEVKARTGKDLPLDYLTPDSRKWFMTERKALEDAYKDFDTIPYHPHEYDEDGNLIMTDAEGNPEEEVGEDGEWIRTRKVTSPAKITELENGPKVKVYRSMQFIPDPNGDVEYDLGDGKGVQKGFLYAPMSAKVDGKWRDPIQLNRWEEAEENPDMANEKGKFFLDKGDGSDPMEVAYAPYLHTRRSPLNEQFSSAYKRPNLVIVESEIPESELTSKYTAEKSRKSTGEHDWPSGKVSNALAQEGMDTRKVILSRWAKPVRVVPVNEVADEIKRLIGDRDIAFPYNVVTPALRSELVKRGIKFDGWQGKETENTQKEMERMKAENDDVRFSKKTNYVQDEEAKGDALLALDPIEVKKNSITKEDGLSTAKSALKWYDKNVGRAVEYEKEVGKIIIDDRSIKDSLNHKYGQRKLDAITSLIEGFGKSVYLTSLPDYDNKDIQNHYFAYPIDYDGERCYVICRTREDSNISRLYIHEVFPESAIKGDTLQTAAGKDQYRRGIALYGSILQEVLGDKDSDNSEISKENEVNFRKAVTPEQDAEYMDAVNSGDMEKAQRMADEAASAAGYTIKAFHGTGAKEGEIKVFNDQEDKWSEAPDGTYWFASNKLSADTYNYNTPDDLEETGDTSKGLGLGSTMPVYLKMENPMTYNAEGANWDDIPWGDDYTTSNDMARTAMWHGYDGLILKNVTDIGWAEHEGKTVDDYLTDDYAVFSPNQIKSAEPVVRDDAGNVIPLSERFNPENNDIRFRVKTEFERKEERVADAEKEYTNKALDSMTPVIGAGVRRISRNDMPKGHKTDKGYYNPATNNVYVCMDNVTDERDAVATVLHETVGYKGLKELFGEQYRDTMARVYGALDNAGRTWVNGYIKANDLQLGDEAIVRAMAEYMARTAERDGGSSFQDVNEVLGEVIDDLFGTDGFRFTNRELAYMLRASYEHMLNPAWLDTPVGRAKDALMRRELGINETDPNKPTDPDGPGAGIRYRRGDTGRANADYNREVERKMTALITENQNADLPVKIGIEKVMKEIGMERLAEDEDYLTRHNLSSSRAETENHDFELFYFNPLKEQVKAIQEKLLGGRRGRSGLDETYERILDYMYAVSGLERNAWKNAQVEKDMKDALDAADERAEAERNAVRNPDGFHYDKELEDKMIASIDEKLAEEKADIVKKYQEMKRDWSGLTALMGRPKEEWQEAEADARAMADAFENEVGKDMTDELWKRVQSCTDFTLDHAKRYGLITNEEYERLHGSDTQPRMWNYYLPLRGFKEGVAEDEYSYAGLTGRDGYAPGDDVVMKTNGRWTEADNPIANILNIAQREIAQGNDNYARQALYNFAVRAGKNSLLSVRKPWYEKVGDKWRLAVPSDDQTIEQFEKDMKEKAALGEARQGRAGSKSTPENKLKLDMMMASKANANQHLIRLKVGGEDRMLWVNGNPAMARAVTGYGRKKVLELTRAASRVISNMFTTYSLDFTAKNLIRDSIYSRLALMMKEPPEYRWQYFKNWWTNFGGGLLAFPMIRLAYNWENGELQRKPESERTEREQMFIDFMHDGGQTGYSVMNSVKQIKRDLDVELGGAKRRWNKMMSATEIPIVKYYAMGVKTVNEAFELLTRFTAYQTSRQMGRSGQQSAYDAKEISVNFNRRGAQTGEGVFGGIAAYLGATHYFYNAGVQGFDNFLRLFSPGEGEPKWKRPVKMSAASVGIMAMGILTPLINTLFAGAGDGDDDWYWDLPDWVRRNNIVLGWNTKKKDENGEMVKDGSAYIALPLPVELRAVYGLGDIAASAFVCHKYPDPNAGRLFMDMLSTASGVLPFNPIEDISGSNNFADAMLRAAVPDVTMFFVDYATNHDYTGRPLQKENPFTKNEPKSQAFYTSTPLALVKACQYWGMLTGLDWAPGVVRDFLNNYMGGFYKVAEDISKRMFTDEDHPKRWDDIPFLSGFTGHIDEDRADTYVKNVLNAYRDLSEGIVKDVNVRLMRKDVTDKMVYETPEKVLDLATNKLQRIVVEGKLKGDRYKLGKTYYEGTQTQGTGEYVKKDYVVKSGKNKGKHRPRKTEIKIPGTDALKKQWSDKKKEWQAMPEDTPEQRSAKADTLSSVQNAWHRYCDAQDSLAEKLMAQEYDK